MNPVLEGDEVLVDEEYASAKDKQRVLQTWRRFLASDFNKSRFTKRLYHHLRLYCDFIAHFDRHGFYSVYFEDPKDTLRFLDQFDPDGDLRCAEVGGFFCEYRPCADLNRALCRAYGEMKEQVLVRLGARLRADELAKAREALAFAQAAFRKYGEEE